jgi:hypothetical protein
MCQAFSCVITKSKKVYWKTGIDSHDQLVEMFKSKDKELIDDKEPPNNTFARIEIIPKDKNYLDIKSDWIYQIDEKVKPLWLNPSYEKECRIAWVKWKKEVYSKFDLEQILHPIHPFKIKPPKITDKHLKLLKERDSVRDSVGDSVWDSVWASVRDSVRDSVWASVRDSVRDSVWDSVWDSVRDSVWAYMGSSFTTSKWKYCEKVKVKGYPFNSVVKLWKMGLVPSYDSENKIWRLHGEKSAKILWEGKI